MILWYVVLLVGFVGYHAYRLYKTKPYQEPEPFHWHPGPPAPKVSFLVPAWNAAEAIPEFIESYSSLCYGPSELILCVGGKDDSLALAHRYSSERIKVLEQLPGEGKQTSLAKSFEHCTGSIIYLTDIDCRLSNESVLRVLEPIISGREAVVSGSSIPVDEQHTIDAVVVHWAMVRKAAGLRPRYLDGLLGRNCAATREAVEGIDGFSYKAPTGTDYRMAQELQDKKFRIWFEPRSEVKTEFAWPLGSYIRKRGRWLRNVLLYAEHPRQGGEFRGALITLAIPFGMVFLLLLSVLVSHFLFAYLALLMFLHGILNRLHCVRETLPAKFFKPSLVVGSALNLYGTLAAGVYAAVTWLIPSLRGRW